MLLSPHIFRKFKEHTSVFKYGFTFFQTSLKWKDLYKFTSFLRHGTYGRASVFLTKHYLSQPLLQPFLSFRIPRQICARLFRKPSHYSTIKLQLIFSVDKDSAALWTTTYINLYMNVVAIAQQFLDGFKLCQGWQGDGYYQRPFIQMYCPSNFIIRVLF